MGLVERLGGGTKVLSAAADSRWRGAFGPVCSREPKGVQMPRYFLLLASAFLLCASPALAQTTSPPAAAAVSEGHLAQARAMSRLLLIDSDVMGVAVEAAFAAQGPQMRQQMLSGPFYDNLRPEHQRSMTAFVDGLPNLVRQEIDAAMPAIAEQYAQGLTKLFNEQELADIVVFLGQPLARAAYLRAVAEGASGVAASPPSTEELAVFAAFEATPSGQAFEQRNGQMTQALNQTLAAGSATMMPRVQQRVLREMCAALGDQAPPACAPA
jgi:hypothetical protein